MFGDAPHNVMKSLGDLEITMNNHGGCVLTNVRVISFVLDLFQQNST